MVGEGQGSRESCSSTVPYDWNKGAGAEGVNEFVGLQVANFGNHHG